MPKRITNSQFNRMFLGKELHLDKLKADQRVKENEFNSLKRADRNHDGKISGAREFKALFRGLDRFDHDGNHHSLFESDLVKATIESAQNSESIDRKTFGQLMDGKRLTLKDLQLNPHLSEEVKSQIGKADLNHDNKIQGDREVNALFKALDHFDHDGNAQTMKRTEDVDTVLSSAKDIPGPKPGETVFGKFNFTPNKKALKAAKSSSLGKVIAKQLSKNLEIYKKASALTGVPVELIAAIHANESQMGTYRSSTHGPEAGYGLDPRSVSTSWGNKKLAKYGLGKWQRGKTSYKARLQSAVLAAEHLKRQANYAGIKIKQNMSKGELAGAVISYMQSISSAKKANRRGYSWMFNPSDANPHPRHPGGTSIGRHGQTIRVPASRKEGLLRWDILIPLIQEQIKTATA